MENPVLLTVSFLLEDFEDIFNKLVNPAEDKKNFLNLQRLRIVMQVLQANGE